jgi:hypothetical protein
MGQTLRNPRWGDGRQRVDAHAGCRSEAAPFRQLTLNG